MADVPWFGAEAAAIELSRVANMQCIQLSGSSYNSSSIVAMSLEGSFIFTSFFLFFFSRGTSYISCSSCEIFISFQSSKALTHDIRFA